MIRIGKKEFGHKPAVIAVIDQEIPMATLLKLKQEGVDLFEVRIDLFEQPCDRVVAYLNEVRTRVDLPLLGTIRENENNRGHRLDLFGNIMPFVDAVDIELASPIAGKVQSLAGSKTVMVSEHDFKKTPDDEVLQIIVEEAVKQGGNIVKLVTTANAPEDAWRLLHFMKRSLVPLVGFAMGEYGTFSRIEACRYGSLFTYGYITRPVAPGQLSALELVRKVKR